MRRTAPAPVGERAQFEAPAALGAATDAPGGAMEDVSRRAEAPAEPPGAEQGEAGKPGPCRDYVVRGVLLTVAGALMVWFGIAMYRQGWASDGTGPLTVFVLGALVLFAGVTALRIGIYRAGAGIDYRVRQSP